MATKAESNEKITALYCRLSVEDIKDDNGKKKRNKEDESNSISNQKQILSDYATRFLERNRLDPLIENRSNTLAFSCSSLPQSVLIHILQDRICRLSTKLHDIFIRTPAA